MTIGAVQTGSTSTDRTTVVNGALVRALLLCERPTATLQDQFDCAGLALDVGAPEVARLLYETAFITAGYSPFGRKLQREIASGTGLWNHVGADADEPPAPRATPISAAIGELRRLALTTDAVAYAPTDEEPSWSWGGEVAVLDVGIVVEITSGLHRALSTGDNSALAPLLEAVAVHIVGQPALVPGDYVDAPVPTLASLVASNRLRRFFIANHDICRPPFGSPELLAVTARCDDTALGPYLGNVPRLIRCSTDIMSLIHLAVGQRPHAVERWSVLLAAHIPDHLRADLAEMIGDRRLDGALNGLFEQGMRIAPGETRLFELLRDAAIDAGDLPFAVKVQKAIVAGDLGHAGYRVALAELLGTSGEMAAAREALQSALRISPGDRAALARIEAIDGGRFTPYVRHSGYTSSFERSMQRAAPFGGVSNAGEQAIRGEPETIPG